ncbi:hypothetical protein BJ165DRAFT_1597299 [Panaeolus papilionaceus]|nr:hypothetical protein BJ165DRAFT_1597299 [Panaeolus papilionaceus]
MYQIFSPNGRVATNLTPDGKFKLAARSIAVIRRVIDISLDGSYCIIEHRASPVDKDGVPHPGKVGIQLCHTFGRANALKVHLITSIEYHLGMEHKSLNIDSRWNCFLAINNFHAMFDNGMWCLLPQREILDRYKNATKKDRGRYGVYIRDVMKKDDIDVSDDNPKYHTYTFLALDPEMVVVPIYRHTDMIPGVSAGKVERILFPYNEPETFQITSHVHPKFVILNLGEKLSDEGSITPNMRRQPHLIPYTQDFNTIRELYNTWTSLISREQEMEMEVLETEPIAAKKTFGDKGYYGRTVKTSKSSHSLKTRSSTQHLKQLAGEDKATASLDLPKSIPTTAMPKIRRTQSVGLFGRRSKRVPLVPADWNENDAVYDPSDDERDRPAGNSGQGKRGSGNSGQGKKASGDRKLKRRAGTPVSPSPLDKRARVNTTHDSSDSSDSSDLDL